MAVNYVTQKCPSCAGTKLEYIKELKSWKCLYCGTMIERHEQADSMFTIKNVVRQALVDAAYFRMDSARNNLIECEKIDSRYVGTIIAQMAYQMNMIFYGGIAEHEQRNLFAQMKKNYELLREMGDAPTDEEVALYEFFESSEAIGVLILTYDTLKLGSRLEFIMNYFEPGEIYSLELNTKLIAYALKNQKYDIFDKLVANTDNIDVRATVGLILNNYPDNEQKRTNAVALINIENSLLDDDKRVIEEYLQASSDSTATKYAVAKAACATVARPSVECLMKNVITKITDIGQISDIFDALMKKNLLDVEIYTILEFAIKESSDEVCTFVLNKFLETNQFVEFGSKHFGYILSRSSKADAKINMLETAMKFSSSVKNRELFISEYLCETQDTPENRQQLIKYLLSSIESLSTRSVEKYLLSCDLDGADKPKVVKQIFDMEINTSFFHSTLNNYILNSSDSFAVKKEIVYILSGVGLGASAQAVMQMLCQPADNPEERIQIFRSLKSNGINSDELLSMYLSQVDPAMFDSSVLTELLSGASTIQENAFARYLLEIKDLDAAKVGNVSRMCRLAYSAISNMRCTIRHNNCQIYCNVVQAYMLISPDREDVASAVLTGLVSSGNDITGDVEASGDRMKFKKYIALQKNYLSDLTRRLCIENKLL